MTAEILVHVAGAAGDDHIQRCAPCGAVLTDNSDWWSEGGVAVWGDGEHGPAWWPIGSLVATDRHTAGPCDPVITYTVEPGAPLDTDEQSCTRAPETP